MLTRPVNPCLASVGDFIWRDENGDGVQDPKEPGIGNVRLTLFLDGRALIEGTDSPDRARAIYDRLVGT